MNDTNKAWADFGEIAQTVERVLVREEEACAAQERELAALRKKLRRRQSRLRAKRRGLERFAEEWRRADDGAGSASDVQGENSMEPEKLGAEPVRVAVGTGR
ncbi:MAG: hypothetical protein ACR2MZ_03445 [Candidatus Dormibacter sp.]|uniref:hypothetical protein n=1 Tax=Candidatus Dormibacter sp. TaxID=2973982 RepID=UPI000DB6B904|nr:MAG: hypothetical protein DLM66_04895 [Candidatus Dormibacteraeota bacterium]